jgi:hypothetical protein
MLIAVTEMNTKDEIDALVEALRDPDAGHEHRPPPAPPAREEKGDKQQGI